MHTHPCLRRWAACLAALACPMLAGCAAGQSSTSRRPTPRPLLAAHSYAPTSKARGLSTSASPVILVHRFVADYAHADWQALLQLFADVHNGEDLVAQMQTWKSEAVHSLNIRVVYRGAYGTGRSIVTLQFTSDPRAIPVYAIYKISGMGTAAKVDGTVTGIHGANFETANWSITRSAHFVVYHSPYELRGTDRRFLADLEYERRQFMRKFGVTVAPVTHYYDYPLQRMMGLMTRGACGSTPELVGCANPYTVPPTIHTSLWPTFHEPIHIYEVALEPRVHPRGPYFVAPLLIAEGTAVALEDREVDPRFSDYCSDLVYIPLDSCARQAVRDVKPIELLSDDGFKAANPSDAYLVGGSLVKYMILHYGYHRFGRFYYVLAAQPRDRQADYDVAARKVFGRTIQQVVDAWVHQLCQAGC